MIDVNLKTIFILAMVGFMNIAIPVVMNFFLIEYSFYINYLIWLNALALFFIILPKKVGSDYTL